MKKLTIKTEDQRLKLLDEINSLRSNNLYIWGNGIYSKIIRDYLREVGHYGERIQFLTDDKYFNPGQKDSVPVSVFIQQNSKVEPVVFGFYNYPEILKKRQESKFPYLYDFHFVVVNGNRIQWDPFRAKEREKEYRTTYELLSDERSKLVMQLYLNAATVGEFHELFTECYEEPSYFNRITEKLQVDTLIDCGAYDGDSIHDFISVFPEYKLIIAIEPDSLNVANLCERIKKENIQRLKIIEKGLGSKPGVLHFKANGNSNSIIDENGDSIVCITTLDEIVSNDVDFGKIFLKMDIEGSELEALHGAENLIREKMPIMSICVYHREEDLIEIPQYIHKIVGENLYNYYLGFHGLDLAELVFYAIPKQNR